MTAATTMAMLMLTPQSNNIIGLQREETSFACVAFFLEIFPYPPPSNNVKSTNLGFDDYFMSIQW